LLERYDIEGMETPFKEWFHRAIEQEYGVSAESASIVMAEDDAHETDDTYFVDTKLLRKQRHALLTAIGDADAAAGAYIRGDSGTSEIRENHIDMLDGLIGMIDDMLDAIEFSRPPEMAEYPIFGGGE